MEVIFLLVLPAALWAQAWYFLGLYTNPRTLGIISGTVAITLVGLVAFGPESFNPVVVGSASALGAFVLLWAIYAALVAAVALWGFDERTLGFYALFLWVVSLLFVGYYFMGGTLLASGGTAGVQSAIMGIATLLLTVVAALVFFYLGPPFARMRQAAGWFELILSIMIAMLGGLAVLGLPLN
jgi:hypothetical protein